MIKKAILLAVLLVVMCFGTAMAAQIDSLASSAGPVSPTQVYVNPGGLGDALIYGYYNVRGPWETIFTVTNTDMKNGARVRLRFREAATLTQVGVSPAIPGCDNGSQEVLDFDICLSPGDMWTGQITSDSSGAARLSSTDTDTFIQAVPADQNNPNPAVIFPTAFPSGVEFKFGSFNLGITADQTREGYFEIIGERQLAKVQCDPTCQSQTLPCCTCGDLVDTDRSDVDNVLMGHSYIVNLSSSATFSYAATALADFTHSDITQDITFNRPNLRDDSETGDIGPVNYALTKSSVMSIYDLESSLNGKTQLIVNFPTKWATHVDTFNTTTSHCDKTPVADIFDDPRVKVTIFDDAEHSPQSTCQFSPCPAGTDVTLPNEVNVIDINASGIFTSDVLTAISTNFDFGWITVDFVNTNTTPDSPLHLTACDASDFPLSCTTDGTGSAPDASVSHGLPAIGYAVMDFAGQDFSGLIPLQ